MLEHKEIKNQADAVLYSIQQLDIEMVDLLLDSSRTYQDFEKPIFIEKLDFAFDEYRKSGDTFLNYYEGNCNSKSCNFNCKGFSFIGNSSNKYFDLIIDTKHGFVHDIYECQFFITNKSNHQIKRALKVEIEII